MKRILIAIVLILLVQLCGQETQAATSAAVRAIVENDSLDFDMETFYAAGIIPGTSRLDIYLSLTYDKVQFIKAGRDSFQAELEANIDLTDASGNPVHSKTVHQRVRVGDIKQVKSTEKVSVMLVHLEVEPRLYQVRTTVRDMETDAVGVRTTTIDVQGFPEDTFAASGILFLDDIEKQGDQYMKFHPRASRYQNQKGRLLAYVEVYDVAAGDSFQVHYAVENEAGSVLEEHDLWQRSGGATTQTLIDIDGRKLPHGSYSAKIDFGYRGKTVRVEESFDWYIEGFPPGFDSIDEVIKVMRYMADKDEYKRMMAADDAGKYIEFRDFWKQHDPTPLTPENELRDEYYRRVAYTNKKYRSVGEKGWESDRGWVYIILGPPDTIDRNPSLNNAGLPGKTIKAIQVWSYYQHEMQLIFYDDTGFGRFLLANRQTFYDALR